MTGALYSEVGVCSLHCGRKCGLAAGQRGSLGRSRSPWASHGPLPASSGVSLLLMVERGVHERVAHRKHSVPRTRESYLSNFPVRKPLQLWLTFLCRRVVSEVAGVVG